MDGGWYWINDDLNSAVASLLPKTVVGNAQTAPIDPGGLTFDKGDNATFVKHEGSGRVGILQHIMPTPPVAACGGKENVRQHVCSACELHGHDDDWGRCRRQGSRRQCRT